MPKNWNGAKSRGLRSGFFAVDRPTCAALIGEVVIQYSNAEATLGYYYAQLILGPAIDGKQHPGAWAAMETFDVISNIRQKRTMLLVAAERRGFPKETIAEFGKLLKRLQDANENRIVAAHGRWNIDDDIPDALVWSQRIGSFATKALVYDVEDFKKHVADIGEASNDLMHFFNVSLLPGLKEAAETFIRHVSPPQDGQDGV